uniref:hypothetical protein n=1 Tax=Chryseobacterium daeguense TaxID=412438 RepID=UPI0004102ABA|nr:hypothetical protein [Chryseobacterium daeguense]
MKRFSKIFVLLLLLLNFSVVFAQKYYDEQWKKVADNFQKGTYKSNIPIILDIQKQAMKENNTLQLIQALKSEFSIINMTRDDEKNDTVSQFFSKIQNAEKNINGDEKLLFKVLMNGFFMDYYNQNSWKINGRTNLNSQDISQIETWSKLDFKNYITKNFQELDNQKQAMGKISLTKYQDLFSNVKNISYFPTLADWYALKRWIFSQTTVFLQKMSLQKTASRSLLFLMN